MALWRFNYSCHRRVTITAGGSVVGQRRAHQKRWRRGVVFLLFQITNTDEFGVRHALPQLARELHGVNSFSDNLHLVALQSRRFKSGDADGDFECLGSGFVVAHGDSNHNFLLHICGWRCRNSESLKGGLWMMCVPVWDIYPTFIRILNRATFFILLHS